MRILNININIIFFITLVLKSDCLPISTQNLVKTQYINQINTWIPEYIVHQKQNSKTHKRENYINITATATYQQILPASLGYNKTKVFAYGGQARHPLTFKPLGNIFSFPGPTINVICAEGLFIKYINSIQGPHLFNIPSNLVYDPLLTSNINITSATVPIITHVHGAVVQSTSDGYPGAFVTAKGNKGPQYNSIRKTTNNSFVFYYPNYPSEQTMFYHDHMIGMTRLNVYAGLAGFYKIQTTKQTPLNNIDPTFDVMLAIADRTFDQDGSLYYPGTWQPEYFADAITVNGLVWPKMNVANNTYRLRILNACNSRFLHLKFVCECKQLPFTVLKGDQNYLDQSVVLSDILLSPAQRYEILIDFSNYKGKSIQIFNDAAGPYPNGDPTTINPNTTGRIMRIDVTKISRIKINTPKLPVVLNRIKLSKHTPCQSRNFILIEDLAVDPITGQQSVLASFLGGQDTMVYLKPFIVGETYEIIFINLTPDTHPIHIHLTNFEIQTAYGFYNQAYKEDWLKLNGQLPIPMGKVEKDLDYKRYLNGTTFPIQATQNGLKDICLVHPGTVKITRVRFTEFDGTPYRFDASKGYGFAFHCHILEHQDNSMMRLFRLYNTTLTPKFIMNEQKP